MTNAKIDATILAANLLYIAQTIDITCAVQFVRRKVKQIRQLVHPPLSEKESAEYLGVAVQTLRNWRHLRKGPAYLKLSLGPRGRVGYLIEDLQSYRQQCRVSPEQG